MGRLPTAWTAAAAIVALVAIGGCRDADSRFTETVRDAPATHVTAAEFADSLAADVIPNIDWITWYRKGRSLELFPLELRTEAEINAELATKGRRLPDGGHGSIRYRGRADRDLSNARMLVIRHLQPPECPVVPCYMGPYPESQLEDAANRLGLPYALVPEEHRVVRVRNSDGTVENVRFIHNGDGTVEMVPNAQWPRGFPW